MELVISLSSVFMVLLAFLAIILAFIAYNTAKLSEINTRTFKLEHQVNTMSTNMQMGQMESAFDEMMKDQIKSSKSEHKAIYRTADGKYTAGSLKELLGKIAADPDSKINPDELNAIKKFFDQISSEMDDEEDDEDE